MSVNILRWSGSKAKLIPKLRQLLPPTFENYIEPFAGSAQLFFSITPATAVLGDLNPHVIDMYDAIREQPCIVASYLHSIPHSRDAYYALRALNPTLLSKPQRAARLIFLMKACFNGVYRTNKSGAFNVPMGNRVFELPSEADLCRAEELMKNTELVTGDFEVSMARSRPGDLIYIDPPYKRQGRYRGEYGYAAAFGDLALKRLLDCAKEMHKNGRLIMLSHALDPEIAGALSTWSQHTILATRTVAGKMSSRQDAVEMILTSYPS